MEESTEVITIRTIAIDQREIERIIIEWLGIENSDNVVDFDFNARGEAVMKISSRKAEIVNE